jgi:hypothetical protein
MGDYTNRKKPRYPVCITLTPIAPVGVGTTITYNLFTVPVNFKFTSTYLGVQYQTALDQAHPPAGRQITTLQAVIAAARITVNIAGAQTQYFQLTPMRARNLTLL